MYLLFGRIMRYTINIIIIIIRKHIIKYYRFILL